LKRVIKSVWSDLEKINNALWSWPKRIKLLIDLSFFLSQEIPVLVLYNCPSVNRTHWSVDETCKNRFCNLQGATVTNKFMQPVSKVGYLQSDTGDQLPRACSCACYTTLKVRGGTKLGDVAIVHRDVINEDGKRQDNKSAKVCWRQRSISQSRSWMKLLVTLVRTLGIIWPTCTSHCSVVALRITTEALNVLAVYAEKGAPVSVVAVVFTYRHGVLVRPSAKLNLLVTRLSAHLPANMDVQPSSGLSDSRSAGNRPCCANRSKRRCSSGFFQYY